MFVSRLGLNEKLLPSLCVDVLEALKRLENEDLSHVIRVTREKLEKEGIPILLNDSEADISLKQYYALPLLYPEYREFAVSAAVDAYWHNHLLDTKSYRRFCHSVYGKFMDHVPLDKQNKDEFNRVTKLYVHTRDILARTFGESVSEKAYPLEATPDVVICTYDYD